MKHLRTITFHPASNGLAERAACTAKKDHKKTESGDLKLRLFQLLHMYRRAPRPSGMYPAEEMVA